MHVNPRAPGELQTLLMAEPGVPLLLLQRTCFDQHRRQAQLARLTPAGKKAATSNQCSARFQS